MRTAIVRFSSFSWAMWATMSRRLGKGRAKQLEGPAWFRGEEDQAIVPSSHVFWSGGKMVAIWRRISMIGSGYFGLDN